MLRKKLAIFLILTSLIYTTIAQSAILFHDEFDNGLDNWIVDDDGGTLEVVDGHLEFLNGKEASRYYGITTNDTYDFSKGVTFEGVMTHGEPAYFMMGIFPGDGTDADEDGNHYSYDSWIRAIPHPTVADMQIQISKTLRPVVLTLEVGEPYRTAIYLDKRSFEFYINEEKLDEGSHGLDFTKGYLVFSSWTTDVQQSTPHLLDDVIVYDGLFDPDVSLSVDPKSKLAFLWAHLKAEEGH